MGVAAKSLVFSSLHMEIASSRVSLLERVGGRIVREGERGAEGKESEVGRRREEGMWRE